MKTIMATVMVSAAGLLTGLGASSGVRELNCRIDVDRSVLPAGENTKAVLKITVEAPESTRNRPRTPVNLCIVLDRSGSMDGAKIEYAREAAIEAIRRLHPEDRISLVTYDSEVETVIPAQRAGNTEWMEQQIRRIEPRGSTALFAGVSQGAAELRKNIEGNYFHRMILLSDGLANVGPSQPGDLSRLGAALQKEQIQVSTVGVGTDYNEDLMAGLAAQGGGNVYFVEHSRDLPRILSAELGEAQQVVARRVVIELNLPEGVTPVRIIGREGRLSSNRIEVPMYHLQGGQSRYVLVEINVPAQAPDARLELARARAVYEDMNTQQNSATDEKAVAVTFSVESATVEASANREVRIELARNAMAEAKDDVIRLADEGRVEEAASRLREAAAEYEQVGESAKDVQMVETARQIEKQAMDIAEHGLDKRERKVFRAENYQMFNQQTIR